MDKKLFIANWKSNKTSQEVVDFLNDVKERIDGVNTENKTIVIAPPFPLLGILKLEIEKNNLPFKISSQDVSMFDEGAYTGEVSSRLVRNFAEYAIVGHSERRENFKETDEMLKAKVEMALSHDIIPIYCVQDGSQTVPEGITYVAFEPKSAIGTGNPDDPTHISEVFSQIKSHNQNLKVLYGGSVNAENISKFIDISNLSGFLVGGASLAPDSFISLLSQW